MGGRAVAGALLVLGTFPAHSQGPLAVYTDGLVNGFQDWGWATRDYANTTPVHSGNRSIAVTFAGTWQGLQIYHPDMNSGPDTSLSFWLHGGSSGVTW